MGAVTGVGVGAVTGVGGAGAEALQAVEDKVGMALAELRLFVPVAAINSWSAQAKYGKSEHLH